MELITLNERIAMLHHGKGAFVARHVKGVGCPSAHGFDWGGSGVGGVRRNNLFRRSVSQSLNFPLWQGVAADPKDLNKLRVYQSGLIHQCPFCCHLFAVIAGLRPWLSKSSHKPGILAATANTLLYFLLVR